MKKIVLVIVIVLVFGGFVVFKNLGSPSSEGVQDDTSLSSSSPSTTITNAKYKDGGYTGSVADAIFGNIQVKLIIQGGKITDIVFLQFPDKAGHTTEVSNSALPILKQEAIAAQSAVVDNVSGATQTSDGFKVTLQSALDQAKAS